MFYERFGGEKKIIGRSAEGRNLYAFFIGTHGALEGICQYAIHAREWITAYLALEHIRRGIARGGVWFLPLMNPDGAMLSTQGLESVSRNRREFLTALNGKTDFSLWKANAEGVDLNVNFPARWGTGRSNVFSPAPENYVGSAPLCAAESGALAEFTLHAKPRFTISWHTKGEEIYWRFRQRGMALRRDFGYAAVLARSTGYALKETPHSAGGYKDWCSERLHIPAFTVEAGNDNLAHPIGISALGEIAVRCGNAVRDFTERF